MIILVLETKIMFGEFLVYFFFYFSILIDQEPLLEINTSRLCSVSCTFQVIFMWNKSRKLQAHFSKVALSKLSVSIPIGGLFLLCQGNLPSAIWRREFPLVTFLPRLCLIMPFHCSNTHTHTHTDHIPLLASSKVTVSILTYKTLFYNKMVNTVTKSLSL